MSITSDEVNYLVYRYLQESGLQHSAFTFQSETRVLNSSVVERDVPPGALIALLQRGVMLAELDRELENEGQVPDYVAEETRALRAAGVSSPAPALGAPAKRRRAVGWRPADISAPAVTTLAGHAAEVFSCAWNPRSMHLATISADAVACVWPVPAGASGLPAQRAAVASRETLTHSPRSEVSAFAWHPDGRLCATGAADGSVRLWSLGAASLLHTAQAHNGTVLALQWSPDGQHLLSSGADARCVLWRARGADAVHDSSVVEEEELEEEEDEEEEDEENEEEDEDEEGKEEKGGEDKDGEKRDLGKKEAGSGEATAAGNGKQGKEDGGPAPAARSGGTDTAPASEEGGAPQPSGSADDSVGADGSAHQDDGGSGGQPSLQLVREYKLHKDPVLDVHWRNNTTFATCGADSMVVHASDEVNAVRWAPGARVLASCSDDYSARLWNPDKSEPPTLHELRGHTAQVYTLAWAPAAAASILATASYDTTVRLWSASSGECLQVLSPHGDPVYGLAFSPEGNEIATASGDHWVRVWDTETGQLRRRMCGSGAAYAVSWSKEANKVAACFSTGTAAVFDG